MSIHSIDSPRVYRVRITHTHIDIYILTHTHTHTINPLSPEMTQYQKAANSVCDPNGCCWGSWKDDGCEGTNRVYSSIVWNATVWEEACSTTPAGQICPNTARGALPLGPTIDAMKPQTGDCVNVGTSMWGKIRLPDPQCGAAPPVKPPKPCFDHTGEYGAYRPDLVNKGWIPTGTSFALIALNWIPVTGTGWTMIAGDPGRMRTVERIIPATYPGKLDTRFLYVVDQTQCASSKVGYLRYGDFVQLRSVNTSQYTRCASGTCSLTDDSGNCTNNDWHTFVITSFDNSKEIGDQVCFGESNP